MLRPVCLCICLCVRYVLCPSVWDFVCDLYGLWDNSECALSILLDNMFLFDTHVKRTPWNLIIMVTHGAWAKCNLNGEVTILARVIPFIDTRPIWCSTYGNDGKGRFSCIWEIGLCSPTCKRVQPGVFVEGFFCCDSDTTENTCSRTKSCE